MSNLSKVLKQCYFQGETEKAYQFYFFDKGKSHWAPKFSVRISNGVVHFNSWIRDKNSDIEATYQLSNLHDYDKEKHFSTLEIRQKVKEFDFAVEPMNHQARGIEDSSGASGIGFFFDPGLGKTKTAIDEFCLLNMDEPLSILIICPKIALAVWESEFEKHCNPNIYKRLKFYRHEGKFRKKDQKLLDELYLRNTDNVFIINYDFTTSSKGVQIVQDFITSQKNVYCVLDESQKIANRKSGRGHKLTYPEFVGRIKYRRCLTGTSITNNVGSIWNQMRFIHPCAVPASYWKFLERYAADEDGKQAKNVNELKKMLKPYYFQATEDILDLPEAIDQEIQVRLSPETEAVYQTYASDFSLFDAIKEALNGGDQKLFNQLTKIKPKVLTENIEEDSSSDSVLKQLIRLKQIPSGLIGSVSEVVEKLEVWDKYQALLNLLDQLEDQQAIILSTSRLCIEKYSQKFKETNTVAIGLHTGACDDKEREKVLEDFKVGKTQYLFATTQTVETAVTLTNCRYMIFIDHDFSSDRFRQVRKRIHRIGQNQTCVYYHLIAKDTLDEIVLKSLRQKCELQKEVLDSNV